MDNISNREFVVIKDVLLSKKKLDYGDGPVSYNLYFKNYYDKTGRTIQVNSRIYNKAFKQNEYYILFKKGFLSKPEIFKIGTDILTKEILDSVIDIDYLGVFYDDPNLIMLQDKTRHLFNKEDLIKDITLDNQNINKSLFLIILIFPLSIFFLGLISINLKTILISIILLLICLIIIGIFNYNDIKINIELKKDNFYIIKDKITDINKNLDFRSTYRLRTLTLKKYKKEIQVKKKLFLDSKIGDEVYLVLNKKNELIKCYNAKYTQFDDSMEVYIK